MPPLAPALVEFLHGPNSILVATQDGALVPEVARGLAVRSDGPDRLTVWLGAAASGHTARNLARDSRIAVVLERPTTHRTLQLKGRSVVVRPAPDEDRAYAHAYLDAFFDECGQLGLPRRLLERVARWPLLRIDVEVSALFEQSPGPGAGEPYRAPA